MPAMVRARTVFLTALVVCVVCSALVTVTAVLLRPIQQTSKLLDRQKHILAVAGLWVPGKNVEELSRQLETRIVDLETGRFVKMDHPENFDQRRAAQDPSQSVALTPEQDIARIKRRARHAQVYLVRDGADRIKTIVLPVHGYGLWSTLYGFLALQADAKTVVGLGFYEHADTPGLGDEVDNPDWKELWTGKQVFDANWRPAIRLVKEKVNPAAPGSAHKVDALSGATLTSRGVGNLLHFWLGKDGFGPFLNNFRAQGEQW
jgi:Na+-transporting NADH:ubiquinone oxidoreductase subunit C